MAEISKRALVPYSAAQMFDLVDNIEAYPEFLPWCANSTVHDRNEDEVNASLILSWSGIQKQFSTCNRLQKDKMIEVRLVEGPFKHLEGFWRFEELGEDGCKILLDLEFEFAGKLLSLAFGPVFHQVANTLVDAFCERAKDVYGEPDAG